MIRLCGFAARKRSARYDRTNLHPHREPETRVSPCLARKHRRDRLRPRCRPQRQIPDHEARERRHVRRGRLVDPAIERPFANHRAPPLRHLPHHALEPAPVADLAGRWQSGADVLRTGGPPRPRTIDLGVLAATLPPPYPAHLDVPILPQGRMSGWPEKAEICPLKARPGTGRTPRRFKLPRTRREHCQLMRAKSGRRRCGN